MLPIIGVLMEQGLSLLANAVMAKGKEVVEDKLGIKLPEGTKPLTGAEVAEMKKAEYAHEEWLIEAGLRRDELEARVEAAAQENVTGRWKADMSSDSWMSKNIRPMTLAAILTGYFIFAGMSAFGYNANESYVSLLGQWGMLIMSFYFGGRTLEKIMEMRAKK